MRTGPFNLQRLAISGAAIAASLLIVAPSAGALTASVLPIVGIKQEQECDRFSCSTTITVAMSISDPVGASNDVATRVVRDATTNAPQYIEVTDAGQAVEAGAGCEAQAGGTVRCALPSDRFKSPGVHVSAKGSVFDLGGGDDTMRLVSSGCFAAKVLGGAGNDVIVQDGGKTLDCNPTIWDGGPGADRASGLNLDVSYADRTAAVSVTLGDGANDGEAGEGDDIGTVARVTGGAGDDTIRAIQGVDFVEGGKGNDTLTGGLNLDGGAGNDKLTGSDRESILLGGSGNDVLRGEGGDDRLKGGSGRDRLFGGAGRDNLDSDGSGLLDGGSGDDWFLSSYPHGGQTFIGGRGKDRWSTGYRVRVTLNDRADDGPAGQRDNLLGIEEVSAGSGVLVGSDRADDLFVGFGFVDGRGGDDVISGNGRLHGGTGRDRITVETARAARTTVDVRDGERDRVECKRSRPQQESVAVKRIVRDASDVVVRCKSQRR